MVKLYVCEISNLIDEIKKDENALEVYFEKLGQKRIEDILKNKRAEDRARALGASLLLLFALKKEGYKGEKLPDYNYYAKGKPYIFSIEPLKFNISHSENIITCVISKREVGVDIERDREMTKATIARVFTENERKTIVNESDYIRLWTMKEAYAKLTGEGISDVISGLEVVFETGIPHVEKLNQNIIKTSCHMIIAEGKLTDFFGKSYFYSVCADTRENVEFIHLKWDKHQIIDDN